jgi:hypothetical protein
MADIFLLPARRGDYCAAVFAPTMIAARKICLALLLALTPAVFGAETNSPPKPLRPFYIIAHGANTLAKARECLAAGANALEIDVNELAGETNVLCIGHGPDLGGGATQKDEAVPLAEFLDGLHALAKADENFCLVYFDCKTLAATPAHGEQLLTAIRQHLNGANADRVDLVTLISVGKPKDKTMFARIAGALSSREGVMVDGYSDPVTVSGFFSGAHVANQAFCDGIVPVNTFLNMFLVHGAVKLACRMRDELHQIRFVGTWSVNDPHLLKRYLKMGVDGIVTDEHATWYNFSLANFGHGLRSLNHLVRDEGAALGVRAATRADNPFAPLNPAALVQK